MNEPRQVPIGVFSRSVSRTSVAYPECANALTANISRSASRSNFTHPGARETVSRTGTHGIGTQTGTHCGARTGSKFAARFAPLVRTLIREAGANLSGGYQHGYHQWLPVRAVAKREVATLVATERQHFARPIKRWFPLRFPRYRSAFHWSNADLRNKPHE